MIAMGHFLEGVWGQLALIVITLFAVLLIYVHRCFNYWKNKGIPYVSGSFPFGSVQQVFLQKISMAEMSSNFYNHTECKYIGFYSFFSPQLLIRDLELIKNVLVKDFNYFTNRGVHYDEKNEPISAHLFSIEDSQWKNLRAKLTPVYTSGKMKMMYPTVKDCAFQLQNYAMTFKTKKGIVEVKDMTARYTLDVIASTALGFNGNNFNDDNTDMRRVANLITAPTILHMFRFTIFLICKSVVKLLRLRLSSKEVEDYFMNMVKQTIEYRETNNVKRNDLMQFLIELKDNSNNGTENKIIKESNVNLTVEEIAAQSFLFVTAGFETSSGTLGFCLYELASNPDVQERLVNEIRDAGNEDVSYDVLQKLPYLDMVISETLRKYPPLSNLQRECSKDYVLPGGEVVEKGTILMIPVFGLHHDPKLFPNPDVFDPERFNKDNIHKIAPYSYLPFGEGPRMCIAMRFGKLQVKLALVTLLSRFKVEICEKTQIPLKIEKRTFTYSAEGGVWLRFKERI